ncbi:hypothetical protein C8J56DRAFT_866490 [Mycena floridula]|nr:hypothetical protein C8J56DRAFT_866490 [Mycena floridula]
MSEKRKSPHVVIVGAGLGGISAGIELKRQFGSASFTICEQASRVGGTWRDNTYPGCGSDAPGHWYSLSTELNPNWSSYYVDQPELQAYWESLFYKHKLQENTQFNASVYSCEWSNEHQHYKISIRNTITGENSEIEAEAIIYAIGGFKNALFPDIPGIDKFQGITWHSAKWRHDVDLKGKKVAVIGNGCSAAQFVPRISADPSVEVVNFCRTPQWFVPRVNTKYSPWIQWIFANLPLVLRWYRNWIYLKSDIDYLVFQKNGSLINTLLRKMLTRYMKKMAPPEELDRLIPKFAPGCKRLIVDPGYLSCLKRPNVTVNWDGIESIEANAIKLKTGELVPADVIIFGTGYSLEDPGLHVRGSAGMTLDEYFASQGGPMAYLGSSMPGFPNLFILTGPNVASGHASIVFSEEVVIQHSIRVLKPVLAGHVKSFEVKDKVIKDYNDWLQKRLGKSVWADCQSYYYANRKSGKNIAIFPGSMAQLWWLTKSDKWSNWQEVGGEQWAKRRRLQSTAKWMSLIAILAAALYHRFQGF